MMQDIVKIHCKIFDLSKGQDMGVHLYGFHQGSRTKTEKNAHWVIVHRLAKTARFVFYEGYLDNITIGKHQPQRNNKIARSYKGYCLKYGFKIFELLE